MRTVREFLVWAGSLLVFGALAAVVILTIDPLPEHNETAQGVFGMGLGALCIIGAFIVLDWFMRRG